MKIKIIDQDIIFLSYDEPNAEQNYADLVGKVPWAKRVHGIKGSDAAHKACAAKSETEYFVTVDADNIIDPSFLNVEIDLDTLGVDNTYVFSWCGKNHVNGLMYGNGGLKLWTKEFVNKMRTHENANTSDIKSAVEFCFDNKYHQFNECYSESFINSTPFQAWRAGFREGVKMCLDQGVRVSDLKTVWWQNYQRALIWCTVGCDVKNGFWSILGAREGCYNTLTQHDWDFTNVRDFEWLTNHWTENYLANVDMVEQYNTHLGELLINECKLEIANLDVNGSKFFKQVYENTPRVVRTIK